MSERSARANARFLTGLLATAGVLHFAKPEPFDGLIPEALPGKPRWWTWGSGVAELGTAALLASPATRRLGGNAAAALFVGVFPGNVKMALDWRDQPMWKRAIAYGRLPLQGDLIRRARQVAKGR